MLGGSLGIAVIWSGVVLAGAATVGAVLLTSGPLAPTRSTQPSEVATATADPLATDTAIVESQRSLADLVAEDADTNDWEAHRSIEAGVALRVPPGFTVTERKWPPYLDSDADPPTELVLQRIVSGSAGEPHTVPPAGTVAVTLVYVPPAVAPAAPPEFIADAASLDVLNTQMKIVETRFESTEAPIVVAQKLIDTDSGTLLINVFVSGRSPDDIRSVIGILTTLELLP